MKSAFLSRTLGEKSRLLVTWTLLSIVCCPAAAQTLRNVQVLFRHGDRTPVDDFPSDPYGADAWPNGFKQLTQEGMRQTRDLGKLLRTRYSDFLNTTYIAEEIYARSTDMDRTLMSTLSVLAGLYPPQGFQVWDPEIRWQPIPVHTRPVPEEYVLLVDNECARYDELMQQANTSATADDLMEEYKDLVAYVGEHAGWGSDITLQNMFDTYDALNCMVLHNKSLPSWVTEEVFSGLQYFWNIEPEFQYMYDEQIYLKAGPFMQTMTERLFNPGTQKLVLYASHDTLMAGVMNALGQWEGKVTPYAGAIFIELHDSSDTGQFVRMYYKNDTVTDPSGPPRAWVLPGCSFDCPLQDFLSIVEPYTYQGSVPDDLRKECAQTKGAMTTVIILSVVFVLVLTGFMVCFVCRKRRNRNHYEQMPDSQTHLTP